jgi:peptidoglycan hydrolase CwlO-like protein
MDLILNNTVNDAVSPLTEKITIMESLLDTTSRHMDSLQSDVKDLDSGLESLKSRVEKRMDSLQSDVESLESDADSDLKSLQSAVKSLQSAVESLQFDLDSILDSLRARIDDRIDERMESLHDCSGHSAASAA